MKRLLIFKGAKARVVILKCKPGAHTRGEPTREFSHSKRHPPTCTIFLNALEKKDIWICAVFFAIL